MRYYFLRYGDQMCTPARRFGCSVMEGTRDNFERLMSGDHFPSWRALDYVKELELARGTEGTTADHYWVATFRHNPIQPDLVFPDPLTEADLELIKTIMMREPNELTLERYPAIQWQMAPGDM